MVAYPKGTTRPKANLNRVLVGAEGIEPPPLPCNGSALPLSYTPADPLTPELAGPRHAAPSRRSVEQSRGDPDPGGKPLRPHGRQGRLVHKPSLNSLLLTRSKDQCVRQVRQPGHYRETVRFGHECVIPAVSA